MWHARPMLPELRVPLSYTADVAVEGGSAMPRGPPPSFVLHTGHSHNMLWLTTSTWLCLALQGPTWTQGAWSLVQRGQPSSSQSLGDGQSKGLTGKLGECQALKK